jgi:hypothetical protein
METWYKAISRHNKVYANNTDVKIADPFNFKSPNFQPSTDSPVQQASYWFVTGVDPVLSNEADLKCYPNPFSGVTTVELKLDESAYVRVVVLDISGRIVANLQDGKLTEGAYQFTFNATNLPRGIYLAKVIAGNAQKTIKVLSF